jgi:hypothetical protein
MGAFSACKVPIICRKRIPTASPLSKIGRAWSTRMASLQSGYFAVGKNKNLYIKTSLFVRSVAVSPFTYVSVSNVVYRTVFVSFLGDGTSCDPRISKHETCIEYCLFVECAEIATFDCKNQSKTFLTCNNWMCQPRNGRGLLEDPGGSCLKGVGEGVGWKLRKPSMVEPMYSSSRGAVLWKNKNGSWHNACTYRPLSFILADDQLYIASFPFHDGFHQWMNQSTQWLNPLDALSSVMFAE